MTKPRLVLQLLGLLLQCCAVTVSAQTMNSYESVSIAQGLSQGMVFDILQDKEGFIWVATKNGLNRYDGYEFKVFTNDPYNDHSLSSNTITKLFEDTKGRIWIGTENAGLNVYDKKSGQFFRIAHRPANAGSLSGNNIRSSLLEMPDGRIMVAAEDAGLNIIDLPSDYAGGEASPIITRLQLPKGTQAYGLGRDKQGNIWIGGLDKTVYRFNPADNGFSKFTDGKLLNSGYLNDDGSIWINGNLFLSDGKQVYPLFDLQKKAAGNIILNPKKELWVTFHQELTYYDIARWEPGKTVRWNESLPHNISSTLLYPFLVDRSGMLWAGTMGYGLRKYNTVSSKFNIRSPGFSVRFIVPRSPNEIYVGAYPYVWRRLVNDSTEQDPFSRVAPNMQIDNFIIASNGDYWIKSDNKGLFRYRSSSRELTAYPAVNCNNGEGDKQPMMEDRTGHVWVPGLGGMFSRINTGNGSVDSFSINTTAKKIPAKALCSALYEDKDGLFWVGTQEGLALVNFESAASTTPVVKWYYTNPGNRNSLNYNHVSCFLDDPAEPGQYLWICTKGGGLNRLNKNTGDFLHITSKDGLPDDVVYGILPDREGNIWGSTNRGIFCMRADNSSDSTRWIIRNFTKANGLQDDEFNTGAFASLANGELAFGGVNGLNIFDPAKMLTAGFMPPVFITNIMVNNTPVYTGDKTGILKADIGSTEAITLNYQQDILTLEFSSLDFTAPLQNRYRYRLEGADKDWIESGVRHSATYLHLPAGEYNFIVQGSNSQGIWSNKISMLKIKVLPPWWRSWWAYFFYVVLLAFAIRTYFRFSVNRARLKSQLVFEQREARRIKEIDGLKTQLYTNITHEFRTPLTIILGMANQVVNNPREHFDNGMNMISRNAEGLLKLVNEMLDLSKLETGKMSLQLANADIVAFLRYLVESFNSLAESQQKQLHFLSEVDGLVMAFDPEKMRQIVSNLLSNALKFTPEKGNVYFSLSEEKAIKGEGASLVIRVKDTGIGVPEDQLERIFDRFFQVDDSQKRQMEGTGIGLSLTKELVKLMDGEISVKSPAVGASKGSEFTVSIPIMKIEGASVEVIPSAPLLQRSINLLKNQNGQEVHVGDVNRPLILLVEDNADVVAYVASCLPQYRLAVAKDGAEGFEIATEIIPDLIISDVMMPKLDGFEMCRRLRVHEHTSHIPIILLTAKADMESRIEGLEKGADAYLEKPFHQEELLVRIRKLLEMRKSLQEVYRRRVGLEEIEQHSINKLPVVSVEDVEDAFARKVRLAIEEHLSDSNFSVEQLCKYVFMSHSQLHRKLDAVTGCSPNKFIRLIRLRRAMDLLKDVGLSISAVSLDCGYNDPGYFSRVFKQEFGVTPQEWRAGQGVI